MESGTADLEIEQESTTNPLDVTIFQSQRFQDVSSLTLSGMLNAASCSAQKLN